MHSIVLYLEGLQYEPRVASSIASIISELAESTLNIGRRVDTDILSECFEELLDHLYQVTLREDAAESDPLKLKVSAFSAMYNLLQYAPRDCENYSIDFMHKLIRQLKESLKIKLDAHQQELQGFFFCTLQCILTNIEDNIPDSVGEEILELVIQIFNQRADVFDEGLIVLCALCNKFTDLMNTKIDA